MNMRPKINTLYWAMAVIGLLACCFAWGVTNRFGVWHKWFASEHVIHLNSLPMYLLRAQPYILLIGVANLLNVVVALKTRSRMFLFSFVGVLSVSVLIAIVSIVAWQLQLMHIIDVLLPIMTDFAERLLHYGKSFLNRCVKNTKFQAPYGKRSCLWVEGVV